MRTEYANVTAKGQVLYELVHEEHIPFEQALRMVDELYPFDGSTLSEGAALGRAS